MECRRLEVDRDFDDGSCEPIEMVPSESKKSPHKCVSCLLFLLVVVVAVVSTAPSSTAFRWLVRIEAAKAKAK